MFFNPKFLVKRGFRGYDADHPVPIEAIPPIHEEQEGIQGGEEGEHFHLTEEEWNYLRDLIANNEPKTYEPVCVIAGEIVFDSITGDVLMHEVTY